MTTTTNCPAHFAGSVAEVEANRQTHNFGPEGRCWDCDCRPWGIAAEWPCGASVPRIDVPDMSTHYAGTGAPWA